MSFETSIPAQLLRRLTLAVWRHPRWFLYPQILLSALCVLYAVPRLKLDINRDHLVSPRVPYQERFLHYRQEFPGQNQHVVVVESGEWWRNRQFLEQLAARLEPQTNLFADVFYKLDLQTLGSKGLRFASASELEQMHQVVRQYAPRLRALTQTTNLNSFFEFVNAQFRSGAAQARPDLEASLGTLPVLERIVADAHRSLLDVTPPPAPSLAQLLGGGGNAEARFYLTFASGRTALLAVRPRSEAVAKEGIQRLESAILETQRAVPGVNVGLTGEWVLSFDELRQAKRDSEIAGVAALLLCSLLFVAAYREVSRPLKAAVCLLIGFGYTLGFAALTVGHLNIISVAFAPMLIGLAIVHGVHLMSRYEEEMRHRRPMAEALYRAMVDTGQGMLLGGLSMAVAFLAMTLTRFRGIQELGLICGGGLLLCLVPMLTALPALLMRGRQNQRDYEIGPAGEARLHLEQVWLRHPVLAVALTAGVCVAALLVMGRVGFDDNLLRLQSPNLPSVRAEHRLLRAAGHSGIAAAVIADSPGQAQAYAARLRALPAVARVEGMADYLTEEQDEKLATIEAVKHELAGLQFAPCDQQAPPVEELNATLWRLSGYLAWAADIAQEHNPALAERMRALRERVGEFRKTLVSGEPHIAQRLSRYQTALFTEWRQGLEALQQQDTRDPLRTEDLPPALRSRFLGVSGKCLLQVYPRKDIWVRANQAEFIGQLQGVVPPDQVTGLPVQIYHSTALLKQSYQRAACYALGAIVLLLWLRFRSPGLVLLALLPVVLGGLWLLGFMGVFGITFNPANLMSLPLLIGIGVTHGIQMLNRFAEERHPALFARSTGKAVLVSGMTAMAGFGTLLLARQYGMRSLGTVMAAGIAACTLAALIILPALLCLLLHHAKARPSLQRHLHHRLGWHRTASRAGTDSRIQSPPAVARRKVEPAVERASSAP